MSDRAPKRATRKPQPTGGTLLFRARKQTGIRRQPWGRHTQRKAA